MMKRQVALIAPVILLSGCGLFSRESARSTSDADLSVDRNRSAATRPAPSREIANAQHALKEAGFDPGSADGLLGAQTRQAIRDFQQAKGLRLTGELDRETREALGVRAEAQRGRSGQ